MYSKAVIMGPTIRTRLHYLGAVGGVLLINASAYRSICVFRMSCATFNTLAGGYGCWQNCAKNRQRKVKPMSMDMKCRGQRVALIDDITVVVERV